MKRPKTDRCPCCDRSTRRNSFRPEAPDPVEPVCQQEYGLVFTGSIKTRLEWCCRACGCRWQHGHARDVFNQMEVIEGEVVDGS